MQKCSAGRPDSQLSPSPSASPSTGVWQGGYSWPWQPTSALPAGMSGSPLEPCRASWGIQHGTKHPGTQGQPLVPLCLLRACTSVCTSGFLSLQTSRAFSFSLFSLLFSALLCRCMAVIHQQHQLCTSTAILCRAPAHLGAAHISSTTTEQQYLNANINTWNGWVCLCCHYGSSCSSHSAVCILPGSSWNDT